MHKERVKLAAELSNEAAVIARLTSEAEALRMRADEQQRTIAHIGTATKTVDDLADEIAKEDTVVSDIEHKRSGLLEKQQQLQHSILTVRRRLSLQFYCFLTLPNSTSWSEASPTAESRSA